MLAWTLFGIYILATAYLSWLGYKRTRDFSSFAIGAGDMSPLMVGITLAASTASAATFIINPGFVYVDGISAWIHMVLGTFLGVMTMIVLLSFRFRRIGEKSGALTIPDWIGKRYGSPGYALFFGVANLLGFAFVVLLVGGISIVMQQLLGIGNTEALLITLVFVTGYVFVGGTYAHAFTNMLQGSLMIVVAVIVLGSGLPLLFGDPGFAEALGDISPQLMDPVNREGKLFNSVFSIYFAGFLVGAAVVCQPHILTKALYVKSDRAVRDYLLIFAGVILLFFLLGSVGLFAHLTVDPAHLVDAGTGAFRQDLVMTMYLKTVFPEWMFAIISIVLLAAAMSTLDGLLVGLSTITANDVLLNLFRRFGGERMNEQQQMAWAYRASHVVLVVIAVAAFFVLQNPPKLLGIFGQVGVYGLVLGVVPPLVAGAWFERVPLPLMWAASLGAMGVHFGLYLWGATLFPSSTFTFANPGVTLALAMLLVVLPVLLLLYWMNRDATAVQR